MRRRENGSGGKAAPPAKRSIVVVDDDVVVPMTLTIALPQTTVIEATRRVPGFECIRTVQPDAIVIDRRMPDGDGLDLVRQIRSDPATNDIPIVVLTAGYDEADRPEVMEAGADGYLAKPFDPEELLAVVEGLIDGRPPRPHRPVAPLPAAPVPAEVNGRAQRRAPLRAPQRATSRSMGTGLPAPKGSLIPEPVAPQGLPAPTKVTVDAVALGATVARAEQRSASAAAEVAVLQEALEEAQSDNRRLHALVATLEAKLDDADATGSLPWAPDGEDDTLALRQQLAAAETEADQLRIELTQARLAAEEVDQLRRELSRAYSEIEMMSPSPSPAPPATRQRITRKQAPKDETAAAAAKPAAARARAPRKPRAPRAPRQS